MKQIEGGVCAAKGFTANGIHCGIRKNKSKRDLSLIFSEKRAVCASVYTKNLVKGAPIEVTKANIADGYAQAILCNSGNANTCNANGIAVAARMCELAGEALGIAAADVVVASTGVIGQPLDISPIAAGMRELLRRARQAFRTCRGGNHDHRHKAQGDCRQLRNRRRGMPHGGDRQGVRHDSSQYGDDACVYHHRLRYFVGHAAKGAVRRCG